MLRPQKQGPRKAFYIKTSILLPMLDITSKAGTFARGFLSRDVSQVLPGPHHPPSGDHYEVCKVYFLKLKPQQRLARIPLVPPQEVTCLSSAELADLRGPTHGASGFSFLHPALPSPRTTQAEGPHHCHHLAPKSKDPVMPSSGGCLYNTHLHRHQRVHTLPGMHTQTLHVQTYTPHACPIHMHVVHTHWYTRAYMGPETQAYTQEHELAHAYTPRTHTHRGASVSERFGSQCRLRAAAHNSRNVEAVTPQLKIRLEGAFSL